MNRRLFDHPECPDVKVQDCDMVTTEQINSWKSVVPERSPEGWVLSVTWSGNTLRFTHVRVGTPSVKVPESKITRKKGEVTIEDLKTKCGMKGLQYPKDATAAQLQELLSR